MMNLKIVDKAKYWCAKTLVYRGFPTPPLKKHDAIKKYCTNYPCFYRYDNSLDSIEFQESLNEINSEARQLFSLFNLEFINAAITDIAFRFSCFLFIFFYLFTMSLFMLNFEHKWIFVKWVLPALAYFGVIFYFFSKSCFKSLSLKYLEMFCTLEVFYISIDLLSNNNLKSKKLVNSLVRRIFNLSKLIDLSGQHKKYGTDRLKQHYSRISKDILDKIDWLHSVQNSTLPDLRKYFNHITYCLVVGKIGEIKTNQLSSKPEKAQKDWDKTITTLERIFVLIKKFTSFLSVFK